MRTTVDLRKEIISISQKYENGARVKDLTSIRWLSQQFPLHFLFQERVYIFLNSKLKSFGTDSTHLHDFLWEKLLWEVEQIYFTRTNYVRGALCEQNNLEFEFPPPMSVTQVAFSQQKTSVTAFKQAFVNSRFCFVHFCGRLFVNKWLLCSVMIFKIRL